MSATRPTINENVVYHASEKIAKEIYLWSGDNRDEEEHVEEIRNALASVIETESDCDGYEIAKKLESECMYQPDEQLVDILSSLSFHIQEVLDETIEGWVRLYNIKPQYSVGQIVNIKKRNEGVVKGEIVKIDEKQAKYTIFCEALGHVREGTGVHGIILPFENKDISACEKLNDNTLTQKL